MNPTAVMAKNTNHLARTFKPVLADKNAKELPARIEIMKAGDWPDDSNKGFMSITTADLLEFKKNFDEGVGMPGGPGFGLPIDFSHEEWDKAAGWMKELVVEGDTLFAEVEWSKAGEEALLNGEFKCISPSFYPGCLGSWHDPEDWSLTAQNVLVGAGLTNIPFFKGLSPIMASTASGEGSGAEKNLIYVSASEKEKSMQLEDIRAKSVDALTEDEKSFLDEHKSELTAEELTKFGFEAPSNDGDGEEDDPADPAGDPAPVEDEAAKVAADIRSGKMVAVEASRLERLEQTADSYEMDKANAFVQAHVERGAIKADQAKVWAEKIRKDASMKDILKNLPDNAQMAGEQGASVNASEATSAVSQVQQKAQEAIKAARENGSELPLATAISQVLANNKDLKDQYEAEKKGDQ